MDKNISELNSKMWYRLLKVIFIFFFLGILLLANGLFFSEQSIKSIDENKTLIFCNSGEKRVIKAKDLGIHLDSDDFEGGFNYKKYFEGYNDYEIEQILINCYDISTRDVFITQRIYEIRGLDNDKIQDTNYLNTQINEMETGYKTSEEKASYLDYSIHLFDIEPHLSYWRFIKIFVFLNFSIIVASEIIKRTFYYIVLGTIIPKKR